MVRGQGERPRPTGGGRCGDVLACRLAAGWLGDLSGVSLVTTCVAGLVTSGAGRERWRELDIDRVGTTVTDVAGVREAEAPSRWPLRLEVR